MSFRGGEDMKFSLDFPGIDLLSHGIETLAETYGRIQMSVTEWLDSDRYFKSSFRLILFAIIIALCSILLGYIPIFQ
jgi:hypothetical protein